MDFHKTELVISLCFAVDPLMSSSCLLGFSHQSQVTLPCSSAAACWSGCGLCEHTSDLWSWGYFCTVNIPAFCCCCCCCCFPFKGICLSVWLDVHWTCRSVQELCSFFSRKDLRLRVNCKLWGHRKWLNDQDRLWEIEIVWDSFGDRQRQKFCICQRFCSDEVKMIID